jgi:hypothetical protein
LEEVDDTPEEVRYYGETKETPLWLHRACAKKTASQDSKDLMAHAPLAEM